MEIVKKNIFSIVCGVVAILAIVAAYWPVGGDFSSLQAETQTHAASFTSVQSLLTKPRKLPLTDPAQTTQSDLTVFPNQKVIDEGTAATSLVSEQSKQMLKMVVDMNHLANPLLVPDALPDPLTDTPRYRFRDLYKVVLSTDPTAGLASDPNGPANLQNDILNGGTPPTAVEIAADAARLYTDVYQPRIITVSGQPVNQKAVTDDYNAAVKERPTEMRLQVAKTKKVYVEPNAIVVNPNVMGQGAPSPVDIWFAQLGLWVQQNACAGIAEANRNAKNILDAPVKRLVSLSASGTYTTNGAAAPTPTPVEGGDIVAVPKVTTISPTGRVSNPLYDVVQFQMMLDVEVARIPYVLAALCRNRLVDVYSVDMVVVDNAEQQARGYIYGSTPVVTLNLKCEAMFMRQWEAPLMPAAVRTRLGIAVAATPAPAPAVPQ